MSAPVSQSKLMHLKSAEETARKIEWITLETLLELAESGFIPHYRIGDIGPLFILGEVKDWICQNKLDHVEGRPLPTPAIRVVSAAPEINSPPPLPLSAIPNLKQIPAYGYAPGVYFLCRGDEVVYVGQSMNIYARLANHQRSKEFDSVYMLHVPASQLNDVEAAFIHALRPRLQGRFGQGKGALHAPRASKPHTDIFGELGVALQ